MGRKNRNRINKESDPNREKLKLEDEEDRILSSEEYKKNMSFQAEEKRLSVIWDTRRAMLDYCNQHTIPLCDYMTIEIFQDFIEYLEEQ